MAYDSEFLRKILNNREELLLSLTEDYSKSLTKQKEYCTQLESVSILEVKIQKMASSYFKNIDHIISQYSKDMKVLSHQLSHLVGCLSRLINSNGKRQVFLSLVEIEECFLVLNQLVFRHEKLSGKIQLISLDKHFKEYHKNKMTIQAQMAHDRYVSMELEK